MEYTTKYIAISANELNAFNEQLAEHTNNGFIPYGGVSISTTHTGLPEADIITSYVILLGKTSKVEPNANN